MTRGKFIVIEGGDGAGKDTQVDLLRKELGTANFIYTRDPGGTKIGSQLREILQYEETVAKETEMLMFLASRAQLVAEVVRPNIERGVHVVCNRFDLSTIAYQIYGRERLALKDFVEEASKFARGATIPDLIVLLDVPPEVGLERIVGRAVKLTKFEKEKIAFHERVRQGYLEGAKAFPNVVIVDATRSVEEVYADVKSAVEAVITDQPNLLN
jgi:dTMP kinase